MKAIETRSDNTPSDTRICMLAGVREYGDGDPVELWLNGRSGRLVIRAFDGDGWHSTNVDLWDLIEWLESGPGKRALADFSVR